jgi:hypothetical protein
MVQPRPRPRIDGIYELGHVLYALDAGTHGFTRGDIERVECFWTFGELHSSSAGFILRLRDGRRAWVELLHTHAFEQEEDFRIDVAYLSPDARLPALNNPHAPVEAWSFDTAHLDRVLASSI